MTCANTNEHATSAPSNYLRYTGEYHDSFTETYHLRARQYDTHLGPVQPNRLNTVSNHESLRVPVRLRRIIRQRG